MEGKVKVKVVYGNPLLGKVSTEDGLSVEILVPGVPDGNINVSVSEDVVSVELKATAGYVDKFRVDFLSSTVDTMTIDVYKDNGILYIECPLKETNPDETKNILI